MAHVRTRLPACQHCDKARAARRCTSARLELALLDPRVASGSETDHVSGRFLRCVLACALALRALVHNSLLVHGAGDVGRSLALGARILSQVVLTLPRAMHGGPFVEWLPAALGPSFDQERASARLSHGIPLTGQCISLERAFSAEWQGSSALVQPARLELALLDRQERPAQGSGRQTTSREQTRLAARVRRARSGGLWRRSCLLSSSSSGEWSACHSVPCSLPSRVAPT
jgi:hypothetical protein